MTLASGIADAHADLARLHGGRTLPNLATRLRLSLPELVADREPQRTGHPRQPAVGRRNSEGKCARSLARADEAIALRRNQIAALIGAGPDRALTIARPTLAVPPARALPDDVTTDLDRAPSRHRRCAPGQRRRRRARIRCGPCRVLSRPVRLERTGSAFRHWASTS